MKSVYEEQSLCCGCAACAYVCPKKAISLQEDSCGFRYPVIDESKCINCGRCIRSCALRNPDVRNTVQTCLAAQCEDDKILDKASSGGVFSALAEVFLEKGGIVCGVQMTKTEGRFVAEHVLISSKNELKDLQGSKYVQSDLANVFSGLETALKEGKSVLFSGTPCQAASVKKLFQKWSDQFYCIDIVCHGTPSLAFFNSYIENLEKLKKAEVTDYTFRDKEKGWGHIQGHYTLLFDDGRTVEVANDNMRCSYYRLFLDGETYRPSCYNCQYANSGRVGDLTIGDFWGIQKNNAALLKNNGGPFIKQKGISCILVNTAHGEQLMREYGQRLITRAVPVEEAIKGNSQLRHPTGHSKLREVVLKAYVEQGYSKVEKIFQTWLLIERLRKRTRRVITKLVPNPVKKMLKRVKM